jgi:SAM-dependent methyltransferase
VAELWEHSTLASARFASQAERYDRYRPRYPSDLFTTLLEESDLVAGDVVVEIGAGTGLATQQLVESGLTVHAVEPAPELAGVAEDKLKGRASFIHGRFEECLLPTHARLVAAFNAWHWIEPRTGLERAAQLLGSHGSLALVWTEVVSWGPPRFEERLAELFGAPWPKGEPHIEESLRPVRSDSRYGEIRVFHHPFARTLDGPTYVAVTQTYGGERTAEQYRTLEQMIGEEFDNAVVKTEDAVLYLSRTV